MLWEFRKCNNTVETQMYGAYGIDSLNERYCEMVWKSEKRWLWFERYTISKFVEFSNDLLPELDGNSAVVVEELAHTLNLGYSK